ncbi:hypothetical protein AGOR_G00107250 [Albula goreensis]|uniref:CLOCK-interacting pacemaker n=1 Tax=Albula goreensis TaxID=1534307 RepID=A0A8T3DMR1_9TELE|nr:hypothetical protein AGOR_G00107250 [Albula goreensis]
MSSKVGSGSVGSHRRLSSHLMDNMKTSKPESERDSGFSDGSSGYLSAVDQVESEEGGMQGTQARPQVAVMAGSYPSLSPMIIMNNVVLKEPNAPTPTLKPWGFQPALEVLPQPQVVFLQPVVSSGNGASQKSTPDKRRKSRKYLPILKSYPKIAPHPGESASEKGASSSSEQSGLTSSQEGRHRHRLRRDKQPGCPVSMPDPAALTLPVGIPLAQSVSPSHHSSVPSASTMDILGVRKPAKATNGQGLAASQLPSAPPTPGTSATSLVPWAWPTAPASQDNESSLSEPCNNHSKRQRFCNTYNILHKSGLLGITLRTKELIRQNRCTQSQLEQLKEQTSLFVEAVRSGDPQIWTKLQLKMMESSPGGAQDEQEKGENNTQKMLK